MCYHGSILLVDDEQDFLDNLSLTLESAGYRTITALDGLEALAVLESHPVDLILSDIGMPHMGGYQLYKHVCQNPRWAKIPFLFLTSYEHLLEHKRKIPGVEGFLIKPIRAAKLIMTVDKILRTPALVSAWSP